MYITDQLQWKAFNAEFDKLPFRLAGPDRADAYLLYRMGVPFDWCAGQWYSEIGTTAIHDGTVKIYCMALPAMFWKFEIVTCEEKRVTVSTGSVSLSEVWPSIELIVKGMLTWEDKQ